MTGVQASDPTGVVHPMADPPGGGCNSEVQGNIVANYLNGALVNTETTYVGNILCTTTAPGQYMDGLIELATLWLNAQKIDEGTEGACVNCTTTSSNGLKICAGQVSCSGRYRVGDVADMTLPAGWTWTSVPDGCDLLTENSLRCSVTTNDMEIPATI
jgi:hypothetical protein